MMKHSLNRLQTQFEALLITKTIMMKSVLFLLMLVAGAVVNSDEEGNFLPSGDEGEGNFLAAGDEDEGDLIADSVDGDYFSVTRDGLYDPISAMETDLPTQLARSNLTAGSICTGCRLLFRARARRAAIAGQVRVQDVRYFRRGVRISAIIANRTSSASGNPRIVKGGIGRNTVTVRFTSGVGQGFAYRLIIWGQ